MNFTSEKGLWVEQPRQPDNTGQRQVLSPAVKFFATLHHVIIPDIKWKEIDRDSCLDDVSHV